MKKTRIAVISDLHIGKKSRALDLCPHELSAEDKIGLTNAFVEKFVEHVSSHEFTSTGKIDFLCIAGDICNQAHPLEFQCAHEAVIKIANALKINTEQIYFVPGNHDIHWPVMDLKPVDFWRRFRYEPLLQADLIFKKQLQTAIYGDFHDSPYFTVWQFDGHLIIGINSAAFDSPIAEHGKHHGLIAQETLDKLDNFLEKHAIVITKLRICVLHHHPIQYSDPLPDFPDFSTATNAGNFFGILSKHKIDIVIHGHKHVPHLKHHQISNNGHPITILGAGSFSAILDTKWVGTVANQFHIINVEGRDQKSGAAVGHVATWDFDISGHWKTSHTRTGLCATEGFGSLLTPTAVIEKIGSITDQFINKSGHCSWEMLVNEIPELQHVNTEVAFRALEDIAKSRNIQLFGEVNTTNRKWVLLNIKKESP